MGVHSTGTSGVDHQHNHVAWGGGGAGRPASIHNINEGGRFGRAELTVWSAALCKGPESRVGPGRTEGADTPRLHTGPHVCPPHWPILDPGLEGVSEEGSAEVQQEPGWENTFLNGVRGEPRVHTAQTHTHYLAMWVRPAAPPPTPSPISEGPGQWSAGGHNLLPRTFAHAHRPHTLWAPSLGWG